MDTHWLDATGDRLGALGRSAAIALQGLSEPRRQERIRRGLYALALLWLVFALARLVWSLLPQPPVPPTPATILNPPDASAQAATAAPVDIEELAGWNLFGTAEAPPDPATLAAAARPQDTGLAGIEDKAKETRLSLKLQGIIASSDPSAARAMIESKREQEQYAVGDKLPLSGNVKVAKILNDRVVLDNDGSYELLMLFDESTVGKTPMQPAAPREDAEATLDRRGDRDVTQMAEAYRQRLYNNPQSLADVVKIAAVREGGKLQGYRVSAGKDRKQFESLGFQANDVVTGVNGIALTDPGKAMELYRIMRSAEEASFNVRRGGEELTLVVGLQNPGDSQ